MKTILIEHNGLWASRIATNIGEEFNVIIANEFTYNEIQKQLNLPVLKDITPDKETRKKLIDICGSL